MPRLTTKPRTLQIQNPAPGADWSFVPSSTDRVILISVLATLTTAVAAGSRMPALQFTDQSGLVYMQGDLGRGQAASINTAWCWTKDWNVGPGAATSVGQHAAGPLPNVWLDPNDVIGTVTNGIQAADQWSNIVVRYYAGREWLKLQRELAFMEEIAEDLGD